MGAPRAPGLGRTDPPGAEVGHEECEQGAEEGWAWIGRRDRGLRRVANLARPKGDEGQGVGRGIHIGTGGAGAPTLVSS